MESTTQDLPYIARGGKAIENHQRRSHFLYWYTHWPSYCVSAGATRTTTLEAAPRRATPKRCLHRVAAAAVPGKTRIPHLLPWSVLTKLCSEELPWKDEDIGCDRKRQSQKFLYSPIGQNHGFNCNVVSCTPCLHKLLEAVPRVMYVYDASKGPQWPQSTSTRHVRHGRGVFTNLGKCSLRELTNSSLVCFMIAALPGPVKYKTWISWVTDMLDCRTVSS